MLSLFHDQIMKRKKINESRLFPRFIVTTIFIILFVKVRKLISVPLIRLYFRSVKFQKSTFQKRKKFKT